MLERLAVIAAVLVYVGVGLWCLVDPVGAMEPVGVTLDAAGEIEIRAMYGGLHLGMAGFLAWTVWRPDLTRTGLLAATLTLGGLGLARTAALLADGGRLPLHPTLCAVELTGLIIGGVLLIRGRR